ncbi:nadh dehydrogenase (ubiquinone) complex i assembly factor 6 [Holotrichia oblita]|uniref:Nadh dehydrogenase (Ubiquinone) complex i assembly factor 6 n=1 Tax=Holotrichia oblita TaxID=644536 RepID=A0ACB9TFG3_HOLOL|nr:nadh dehydrogenase (ubiquinone) complex i assembly factor 6 [Holotrichia oblita]
MNLHCVKQYLSIKNSTEVFIRRKSTSASYCLDSVKKYDYENFICTLLLKDTGRSSAIAVRSFNIEVARVSEQVTQKNIGLMRLKFWEDLIDKVFTKDDTKVPQHPVAIELFKANLTADFTKRHFKTLITSRSEYMNKNTFSTLEDIEKYTEKTVSHVYYLILEGNKIKNIHADHAASHIGKAQGIVQQLRTIPISKQINLICLPQEILAKNKVSHEEILRAKKSDRLTECVYEVADRAHQHLSMARKLIGQVPKEARDVLLPAINVDFYLDRLQKVHYDIFHPSLRHRSWLWIPKLWVMHYRNQY